MVIAVEDPSLEKDNHFNKAIALMESEASIFITGKAGTGKSTLLNYFRKQTQKRVVVLAPTGVAALNVQGQTIHSFFGFRPDVTLEKAHKTALRKLKLDDDKLFRNIDRLIIDEISMVRADLLDCVDIFLKTIRKSNAAFGGVPVTFIGDLYQLSPVVKSSEKEIFQTLYPSPYFFSAHVFPQMDLKLLELEKVHRQKDPIFVSILNGIRNNSVTAEQLQYLNQRVNGQPVIQSEKGFYVTLAGTNDQAQLMNQERLRQLNAPEHYFDAEVVGDFLPSDYPTEKGLVLKEGAQVMLLNNDSLGRWVNGSMGVIVSIEKEDRSEDDSEEDGEPVETVIQVRLENGSVEDVSPNTWDVFEYEYEASVKKISTKRTGSFRQYPLRLAWALTIHKSQGKTFDGVIVELGRIFAPGQLYVALSRCRSLEGLVLRQSVTERKVMVDYRVVKFMTSFQYQTSEKETPLPEKISFLERMIAEKKNIQMLYLKAQDEKTRRTLRPVFVGEMTYQGKKFMGLRAYCEIRRGERTFRVDRILEMSEQAFDISSAV